MEAIALCGIAGLLVLIIMILTTDDDRTNNRGTWLVVVALLGMIAALTYIVTTGPLFFVVGFLLLVIAWLTSLILHAPFLVRWGFLAVILGIVYTMNDNKGLLVLMPLIAIGRLIYILFRNPLRSIHSNAEQDVLDRSARYLDNVRRTVWR